jgi:hypothetical protein
MRIAELSGFSSSGTSVARKFREKRSSLGDYEASPGGVGVGRGEPLTAIRLKPGGVGVGRGEPLAAMRLKPGGVGVGRGEPLAAMRLKPGGVGVGRGEPLAAMRLKPGGVGVGRGDPLTATRLNRGGVGVGSGDPLSLAAETRAWRLLNRLLTELLMWSTIEIAKASNDSRIEIFVFKVETSWQQP